MRADRPKREERQGIRRPGKYYEQITWQAA